MSSIDGWRRGRAAKRVKPGDGHVLKRFRWWQMLTRSLFSLRITSDEGRPALYAVDVRHGGNTTTGELEANLFLDGRHTALSKLPARFPVAGGTIEVAASTFGLKRCHFVAADGSEQQLVPDDASAEGRRARLDRAHPAASRRLGLVSIVVLVAGVALAVPQLAEALSSIPPIAENIGTFSSPVHLPFWLNVALAFCFGAASTERALRMRYHWLLDGVAN